MKKFILLLVLPLLFFSCKDEEKEILPFDRAYSPYISAFTSGVISAHDNITIQLTANVVDSSQVGKESEKELLSFSPAIDGKAIWRTKSTLEFVPEKKLSQDKFYDAYFDLGAIMQVPDSLSEFQFQFRTRKQQVTFEEGILKSSGKDVMRYEGTITTSDRANPEEVEKIIEAEFNGEKLPIEWTHGSDGLQHNFVIRGLEKQTETSTFTLSWDATSIGVDEKDTRELDIPARGLFQLSDIRANNGSNQHISIIFSEPVDPTQNLEGLVSLKNGYQFTLTVESNQIFLYPKSRIAGEVEVIINQGIRSADGEKLAKTSIEQVLMEEIKPAIRLVGNGTIIPNSKQLTFPFEAVNLSAVDVSIVKVYENNILSFLQDNPLGGNNQLYKTGDILTQKAVQLNPADPGALKRWARYGINLEEVIDPEPGAIYYVNLSFRPQYSTYECTGTDLGEEDNLTSLENYSENENPIHWNLYSDYDFEYDWRHRDDPCHKAYYRHHRFVNSNVLSTNIGLVAKHADDGTLQIITTDILEAKPRRNVDVTVYNYRMQPIESERTNGDGIANFELKDHPYFVVAEKGKEKGYMRLAEGEALSMSRFETEGVSPRKGLKATIYGERDVWRPGDSIYLTYILRDPLGTLPQNYPVSFTLTNPRNQVVEKFTKTPDAGRFYTFRIATNHEAITGNYSAVVRAGGITTRKTVKVETIKPNRLKVDFEPESTPITSEDESTKFNISSQWLHGAPASGLEYKVEMALAHSNTSFDGYPKYEFDDKSVSFYAEPEVIGEGNLDEDGKATFTANLMPNQRAPGKLKAVFKSRVFERSGNFSVSPFTTDFYPYPAFVGIKKPKGNRWSGVLNADSSHNFSIVVLDADGNPIRNREVTINLYRLNWRWWWQRSDENISSYVRNNYVKPLQEAKVTTDAEGKANWVMSVDEYRWGRYLIWAEDKQGGHRAGEIVLLDRYYYGSRGRGDAADGASMLPLSADKENYEAGETATISLPASQGGRVFVSLESGSSILKSFWKDVPEGQETMTIDIETTEQMAPNIYANIMLLQPHAQTANDLPIRMYGVLPIKVEDPQTHLNPVIQTAEKYRPNSDVSIAVSEKDGKPMTYTLAVVDEGLLGITGYRTPDPWDHFFAKEALGVKTWDLYDEVLGAYGSSMQQLLSIGGGEALLEGADKDRANRFKPMVRFLGPFQLEKGKTANHEVDIPQYVGAVRVMVVAGNDEAYGSTDKTVEVKKPLMVLSTAPRVLGPGETARIPVEVFAMENNVKNVTVNLSTNELFEIKGSSEQKVRFDKTGSQLVFFEIEVNQEIGIGKLSINASSGSEKASEDVEMNVRHPNTMLNQYVFEEIETGSKSDISYKPFGIKGTNSATLEVSALPPMNLGGRVDFLIRYPYGCVEQTTSSVFPQLFLSDVVNLSEEKKEKIENNIELGIRKLLRFQHANGGLRYWPGHGSADDWSTSYAGHFMLEAKRKGYNIPYGFLESWTTYQTNASNNWSPNRNSSYRSYGYWSEHIQAYRLYTLALHGQPALGAMNRMLQMDDLSQVAKWRLAAAYAMAGQKEVARDLIKGLDRNFEPYRDFSYTYGSALRDKAMALETLVIMEEQDLAKEFMEDIAANLSKERWLSTQTTAYCLIAVSKYATSSGEDLQFEYTVQNSNQETVESGQPVWQREIPAAYKTQESLNITNKSSKPIYTRIILSGKPPVTEELPSANNVSMDVEFLSMDGKPINITSLEQGTDFLAKVTIRNIDNRNYYDQMALTQIFPSGWEIRNVRMDGMEYQAGKADDPEYQNIRDDRVYTYFDLGRRDKKTFVIPLSATYAGRYYLPAFKTEAMYDNDIFANSRGQWVEVVTPGEQRAQK